MTTILLLTGVVLGWHLRKRHEVLETERLIREAARAWREGPQPVEAGEHVVIPARPRWPSCN